jgi:hypothetical protein
VRATLPENPPIAVTVTSPALEAPASRVKEVGLAEIVKSFRETVKFKLTL